MEQRFKDFEKTIKGKHSIRFTPRYQEVFSVSLKPRTFLEIAAKTAASLDWEVLFQDDEQIEIHRKNSWKNDTHSINAKINHLGRVEVKSESLGNEIWDLGSNSKRVKLFIYAFNDLLKDFDSSKISDLENEIYKKDNMDDYVIPEHLPAPPNFRTPQPLIPFVGITVVSLILAYILAILSVDGIYIIGIFELGVGLLLGISFKFLLKLGNFTDWKKIKNMLIYAVGVVFIFNLYFQYLIILSRNNYEVIGFVEFMRIRIEYGLTLKNMNVGSIGLIIAWIVEVVLMYFFGYLRTLSSLLKLTIERVPVEVIDFVTYHFVKGKDESAVRTELAKMGWETDLQQDIVMEAIGGIQGAYSMNKKE